MGKLDLYNADERGVVEASTHVCTLSSCTAATVRREVNGEYSLTAEFPAYAVELQEILAGRAIRAAVSERGKKQLFIVKNRRRNLTGGYSVYAEHQSYYYNGVVLNAGPVNNNGRVQTTFNGLWQYAKPSITDLAVWTYSRSSNLRVNFPERLTPMALASALKQYLVAAAGGELIFDGFDVEYVDAMGGDYGAEFRYGANLTGLESEDILDGYASGLYPYWGSPSDANRPLTVRSNPYLFAGSFPMQVIIPYDLNQIFDAQPTQEQIEAACQEYEATRAPSGIPVSLLASRARISGDVPVDLGDTVSVICSPWGIKSKTRILALSFDALRERCVNVQLGKINPGFPGAVKNM